MPTMNLIRITTEDPRTAIPTQLISELSAELSQLYPDLNDGTGSGGFKPEDVLVPRAAFMVAWLDDEPVGCGALRPLPDTDAAEIKRMFVRPALRGKGISRSILAFLEATARAFGYTMVMLETGIHQTEAIGLYESSGYQRMDCYGSYQDSPISLCYEKKL
jgi:putative acetyltransferase